MAMMLMMMMMAARTAIIPVFIISISSAHPLSAGNVSSSVDVPPGHQKERQCWALDGDLCPGSSWTHGVTLPNLYGQYTAEEALAQLRTTLEALSPGRSSNDLITQFFCTLYLPPCPHAPGQDAGEKKTSKGEQQAPPALPLPCRPLCEMAQEEAGGARRGSQAGDKAGWPASIHCQMFPLDRCYTMAGPGEVKYVTKALVASGVGALMRDVSPKPVASLDAELGEDDTYEIQIVTLGTSLVPPRRYDLSDLGDPAFFQGWADVQGTGAANDYCRVIGKGKRRFLSCALAGTRGQDHQYVSKLGFDPGHPGTWFMRDVDSDGRDDYCRCWGQESLSRVVCMKAGEKGFYGSTVQGGSQYTFELLGSQNCHHKALNPYFGL